MEYQFSCKTRFKSFNTVFDYCYAEIVTFTTIMAIKVMNRSTQSLMCQQDEPISKDGIKICYRSKKTSKCIMFRKMFKSEGEKTHVLMCSNIFNALVLTLPSINST